MGRDVEVEVIGSMSERSTSAWVLVCGLALVLASPSFVHAQAAAPASTNDSHYDCGTLALYHLLQLEGLPIELPTIESRLPVMPPAGYSMKELRDAAGACGLQLSGLRLKDPSRELDRPMIAFLQPGHYLVVRPVGHTGKLIQVLNGTEDSTILDKGILFARPEWTGLVLAPRRRSFTDWLALSLVGPTGLVLLLLLDPRLRALARAAVLRLASRRQGPPVLAAEGARSPE